MNRYGLVAGLLCAAVALGGIIVDGMRHQSFGWSR